MSKIYIVEIPHQCNASAWSADAKGVISYARAVAGCDTIYEQSTTRKILSDCGYSNVVAPRLNGEAEVADYIESLASRFGMDSTIYRGFGEAADWQLKPIDELTCALNYIGCDLHLLKVYMSAAEALSAVENDEFWYCHQGSKARCALRALLVRDGFIVETNEVKA